MVDGIVGGFQDMINVTDGRMEEWKNVESVVLTPCEISFSESIRS